MRSRFLGAILSGLLSSNLGALEVGGVSLEDSLSIQGTTLRLNGAGVRNKFFIDVYVAGLYLQNPGQSAEEVITGNELQSVRLIITSSQITRDRLVEAITDGIRRSAGPEFPRYQPMLDELWAAMPHDVSEGDVYDFTFVPGEGVHFIRNGQPLRIMPQFEFKKILFGIWLGKDPVQPSLKEDLLGKA